MKDFIFDLQRFVSYWKLIDTENHSVCNDSIEAESLVTVLPSVGAAYLITSEGYNKTAKTIKGKTLVISLSEFDSEESNSIGAAHTWTMEKELNIGESAQVTIQNGTLALKSGITNNGSLVLRGGASTNDTLNVSLGSGVSLGYGDATYKAGSNAPLELIYHGTESETVRTQIKGSDFTIADGTSSTTYTASSAGLSAKISIGSDSSKVLYNIGEAEIEEGKDKNSKTVYYVTSLLKDLSTEGLEAAHVISGGQADGKITISSSGLQTLDASDKYYIISEKNYSFVYGTIHKDGAGNYTLGSASGNHTQNATLSTIAIGDDSATVWIDSDFNGREISMKGGAVFSSTDEKNDFTVTQNEKIASVANSTEISLSNGSIQTAQQAQSVTAGSYTVYGYTDTSTTKDGIIIAKSGTRVSLGGVNQGESFTVLSGENETVYTFSEEGNLGILGSVSDKTSILSGGYSLSSEDSVYTVDLNNAAFKVPIAPADETLVLGSTEDSHNQSAIVVNELDKNMEWKIADLNVKGTNYTLSAFSDDEQAVQEFQKAVTAISIGGGNTTIDSVLGEKATIKTKDGSSFLITGFSAATFNLDGTKTAPTIGGVSALTLYDKSTITALQKQSITFGDNGDDMFTFTGSNVTVSTDGNYSIDAVKSNKITLAGVSYTVGDNSDGMTFIGSDGSVTLAGLSKTGQDTFIVGGEESSSSYSVRTVGFIKQTNTNAYQIYSGTDDHSLSGYSIAFSDLDNGEVWSTVLTAENKAFSIPALENNSTAVVADNTFNTIFGSVSAEGTTYTFTQKENHRPSAISLNSAVAEFNVTTMGGESYTLADMTVTFGESLASLKIKDETAATGVGYTITSLKGGFAAVSGASAVTIFSGGAELDDSTPYYINGSKTSISGVSKGTLNGDGIVDISVNSSGSATITGLDAGEIFNINGTNYTLLSNGRFLKDGTLYKEPIETGGGSVILSDLTDKNNWYSVAHATLANYALTLSDTTFSDVKNGNSTYFVIDGTDSVNGYENIYGTLEKEGTGSTNYTLTANGSTVSDYNTLVIGAQKTVSMTKDFAGKTIKAGESASTFQVTNDGDDGYKLYYTSNVISVSGASALTLFEGSIVAAESQSIGLGELNDTLKFTGNNISISSESSVFTANATAGNKVTIGSGSYTIDSNSNGMTFIESSSGVTLGDLGTPGQDTFIYGGASYSVSSVGFVKYTTDGDKNYAIYNGNTSHSLTSSAIAAKELDDDEYWIKVLEATSDKVTIESSLTGSYVIVDTNNFSKNYGTLSGSAGNYTFTGNGTKLKGITLTGNMEIVLPATLAASDITIGDGTNNFALSATSDFTVNTAANLPSIVGADSATVTGGAIYAAVGTSITATTTSGNRTVVPTKISGNMTVGVNGVGELDTGETLTIDGISYEMTAAGLFDAKNNRIVPTFELENNGTTYTFTEPHDIIAVNGTTLDLSKQTSNALVYDSLSNPTTFLGTFTVGTTQTLAGESLAADKIKTVKIAAGKNFDVNFATQIEMPKGTAAINSVSYDAQSALTLDSDGSATTLYAGTVKLDSGTPSVKATNNPILTVASGSINVTAAKGSLTRIANLDAGESFTYDGKTYTQSAVGLVTGTTLAESLKGTSINVADIAGATFVDIIAADNGVLNLNTAKTAIVVDSLTNPTKKYGNITVSDGAYTLDFEITATTSSVATVNGKTYTPSSGTITVKTNATTSTLYEGTVNLAAGTSVTADKTLTAGSGTMTATAKAGVFSTVDGLDSGESFTYGGTTYTQSALGLLKDNTICTDLAGTSVDLSKLSSVSWLPYVAPVDGVIDLTNVTATSVVFNSLTNPTTILGTLTKADTTYTTDFATKLSGTGNLTVNGKSYTPSGKITVSTTASTSTLFAGTVSLAAGDSVTADKTLAAVNGTVTATAADGKFTTINALDSGDSFTLDGTTYTLTAAGLFKDGYICTEKVYSSVTTDLLNSNSWTPIVKITDGALDVTSSLTSGLIVSDDLTKIYGTLSKSGNTYTLSTASNANATLSSICANGTKLEIAPDFATIPLSTSKAKFSNVAIITAQENFTLDDTGTAAAINNVKSFTLTEGIAKVSQGQSATVGTNTVTATNGDFTLDVTSLTAIDSGDTFKLNGTEYTKKSFGLFSGNNLVTSGFNGSTLTFADIEVLPIIAPIDGNINLATVTQTSGVVDNISDPTEILGTLTKDGTTYTTNFATNLLATGTVTVNGKSYTADGSITVATTATSSTLKSGTVNLTGTQSVTTTSGDTIAISSGELSVIADTDVIITKISSGDAFALNGATFTVTPAAPMNAAGEIWAGRSFANGLTTTEIATASNWLPVFAVSSDLLLEATTLANGDSVVLVDNASNPTKIFGTLSKENGVYTLIDNIATETLNSITVQRTSVNVDNDLSKVPITTITANGTESVFTVTPSGSGDTFLVDATKSAANVDGVTEIDIDKGKINGDDGVTVKTTDDSEGASVLLDNGKHTVGDEEIKISGLEEDSTIEAKVDDNGNITDFVNMEEGSKLTIDGRTYTAPEDDSTLHYTEDDGWYFDDYELEEYTVTVEKKGTVTVDPGVKFTDVVDSGRKSTETVDIATDLETTPVTVVNEGNSSLKVTDENGTLIEGLAKNSEAKIQRSVDEIIVTADSGNTMTLAKEDYVINGVEITTSGSTKVTTTDNGVAVDLSNSGTVNVDNKTISGTGTATLDASGNIIVDGVVKIDDVTINSDKPVNSTVTSGLNISGDANGYQVNVVDGKIVGLEGISGDAVISGVDNATVKTDSAGSLTADKTFTADGGTTYTLTNGKVTAAQVSDTISGDFSGGVTVNGNPVTVQGGNATVSADGDVQTAAGSVTVDGHGFTSDTSPTFTTENGKVTGVELTGGNITLNQNETDFKVNDETLTLAGNTTPVSLGIAADGKVTSASGVNGSIDGLEDATVYDAGKATINGKKLDVSGNCAAVVEDGVASSLVGVTSGATIKSAPNMAIEVANGNYTVGGAQYTITDTLNGSCHIDTNSDSDVSNIENFAGSISGAVSEVTLNGKSFGTNDGSVTVSSDGSNITGVYGIKDGDSIGGDIDQIGFTLPEGNVTVNDNKLKLEGMESAQVSNGGKSIAGLTKDASLSASQAGNYSVNGRPFAASGAASFTVNRDGAYKINDDFLPVIESTPSNIVKSRGYTIQDTNGTITGDKVAIRGDANVTVPVDGTNIIATSGSVTLQNYSEGAATIQTYEYTNLGNAIVNNNISFGNGVMTLGDAVITYTEKASANGSTVSKLLNAVGSDLLMGFTHTAGGKIDLSDRTESALLKGNYAGKSSDTQKSGGSDLKTGDGNDTLLIGGGDSVDAGAGTNTIFITDARFRESAATITIKQGTTRVSNFNGGFTAKSDVIVVNDVSNLDFNNTGSEFVINTNGAQVTLYNLGSSADLVTSSDLVTSYDMQDNSYKLKIGDSKKTYNAAIAKGSGDITVSDSEVAELFYGNDSGVSFSEFSGTVRVNLDSGTGSVKGSSAKFNGINKLEGGSGSSELNGAKGTQNTLIAGSGNGSLWSNAGADLMVGKTNKTGTTTFYFLADDGRDTITGFDFATSADSEGDLIDITKANEVTDVWLNGSDVVMQINESSYDYLTLVNAKGKDFRINNLMAKVDENLAYDANVNCYVATANNATLSVDSNIGNSDIWLNDSITGVHGKYYLGDIQYIDATAANGSNILAGNSLNNVIYGGKVANSLWGGYGDSQDTLIGGKGHNAFYFGGNNGYDIVQNAHDGDVIDLTTLNLYDIAASTITAGGAVVEVIDGSKIEVQSNASIEYRLKDGTYTANHTTGEWIKK